MATARIAAASLLSAWPAAAFDPYEIQVYDGTADEARHGGLEVHLNRHTSETHLTLEPSYGVTSFWEMGGYFQSAQGQYRGVKLRTKLIVPEGRLEPVRLGLNFEISLEPGNAWGGEIRPIFAFENEQVLFAANPNISFPARFEPAAMAKWKSGPLAFGLEYYGTLPGDEEYLFQAIDLLSVKKLELNFALGEGLTRQSQSLLFKMIVGYVF